jgi:hypothetical protein
MISAATKAKAETSEMLPRQSAILGFRGSSAARGLGPSGAHPGHRGRLADCLLR